MTDVLVVGGGVIGCGIARRLAQRGAEVTVLERDRPGEQASWAAAGMLSPLAEAQRADPFLALLRASRALYPAFAAALHQETGVDVAYRCDGTLLVALTERDEATLDARYAWQRAAGMPVERLTAAEARALEPELSAGVRAALRFAEDHQVDNRRLSRALWEGALAAGARVRPGAEVRAIVGSEGGVEGVELVGGERLTAGAVVVAAGCWAGALAGLPTPLPVEPVHGQIVALERVPPPFRHVLDSPRGYLVPRADGRVIVGATVERTGFARAVTAGGVRGLLDAAVEIAPGLAAAPLVESWSGLRPDTPDHHPILGADPRMPGLFYAAGHFRNGILLAPITAEALSGLIVSGEAGVELEPFSVERFRRDAPSGQPPR